MKDNILDFLANQSEIITEAIIIIIAMSLLLWPIKISGTSMESTIRDGDWVFGCKAITWFMEPPSGSIVMFNAPGVKGNIIKRVVAKSGDKVEIKDGKVFVNDKELDEKYLAGPTTGEYETIVSEGFFFVMGDNRATSMDSRSLGQIPTKNIKSRIIIKFYPFSEVTGYF